MYEKPTDTNCAGSVDLGSFKANYQLPLSVSPGHEGMAHVVAFYLIYGIDRLSEDLNQMWLLDLLLLFKFCFFHAGLDIFLENQIK